MKQYLTELTPIQALAQNTINNIEKAYQSRWGKVAENRLQALENLKQSLAQDDLSLIKDYFAINFVQKNSFTVLGIKYSVFCKEMALFLFQAKELCIQEYNHITNIILDRLSFKENYDKKWKELCQHHDLLSKKVLMEQNSAFFLRIDFDNCLGVFKTEILQKYGCHDFTPIRPETIMDIFIKAYESNDTAFVRDMLNSQAVTNRIEELWRDKNLYTGFKYTFTRVFMYSNMETKQCIFSSSLFCKNIEQKWLQKFLRNRNMDCEKFYQSNLGTVEPIEHSHILYQHYLEAIRLFLDIYGDRLDKKWIWDNVHNKDYHPALRKIYSKPLHNSLGFYQYFTFFWKDSPNACSLPREVDRILQKNFIEIGLEQERRLVAGNGVTR